MAWTRTGLSEPARSSTSRRSRLGGRRLAQPQLPVHRRQLVCSALRWHPRMGRHERRCRLLAPSLPAHTWGPQRRRQWPLAYVARSDRLRGGRLRRSSSRSMHGRCCRATRTLPGQTSPCTKTVGPGGMGRAWSRSSTRRRSSVVCIHPSRRSVAKSSTAIGRGRNGSLGCGSSETL